MHEGRGHSVVIGDLRGIHDGLTTLRLSSDPTCVRKGTRVWSPSPALPGSGEGAERSSVLPAGGERARAVPPFTGGPQGGAVTEGPQAVLIPIEAIQPGQLVFAHDGKPHRVLRVIHKRYRGQMIGIRQAVAPETLWLTADHRVLAKARPRTLGGQRDWSGIPAGRFKRSQQLRRQASPAERKLWAALRRRRLGVKFRRQHPIGRYIADFYSREAHLVVEVDGSQHFTPESQTYDAERDAAMRALGLDVVRFTTRDVETNLEGVCQAIENQCRLRTENNRGARWMQAGSLQPGDTVYFGLEQKGVPIDQVETHSTDEDVFDLEVEATHSFITDVCAVHNCGSGATVSAAQSTSPTLCSSQNDERE